MKKYIYQTDTYDCGAAALSTILHHYGTSLSLSKIRDLTHTKKWNNCFRYCKSSSFIKYKR